MAEQPSKKRKDTLADRFTNRIEGEEDPPEGEETPPRPLFDALDEGQITGEIILEHLSFQDLITLRSTNKEKQRQVDHFLRTQKYKNWGLQGLNQSDLIYTLARYTFFDFDPRYSIDFQTDNKFEKIHLIEAKKKDDVAAILSYLFENDVLDERVYLTIPRGTKTIEEAAFTPDYYESHTITKVWMPPSVTKIEKWAFADSQNLTKLKLI